MKNTDLFRKKALDVKFDLDKTHYKYVETIGTGAYGVVCHAKKIEENKDYAIKKIKNPFLHKVTLIRALREIKILNHFDHPNIISIVDIFLKGNNDVQDIYVVFTLMESDLHKIIHSNQNLSDDHIRYFMYQILCGVNYIHSASVIHRDLKPANILVNSNCLVKITDFGMARLIAVSSKQNSKCKQDFSNINMTQYVMTRWYRAPELLMGQMNYNSKIDLWSCGCIISELYLKKAIFRGDNMILQLKDIVKKIGVPNSQFRSKVLPIVNSLIDNEGPISPTPISDLVPTAPKKVIDLLSHLLVYDSDERWSAKQSLRHIFFVKYRNPGKETICESSLDLTFEEEQRSLESLRNLLFDDILSNKKHYNLCKPVSPLMTLSDPKNDVTSTNYSLKRTDGEISAESHWSDRTLSVEFDAVLGFPLECYENSIKSSITKDVPKNSEIRTSTVSQFTRNKLISSLSRPRDKFNKKITAVQRQNERKERRLQLKHKRNKMKKSIIPSEFLSDWDKSSLKRWEYLSNSKPTQTDINIENLKKNDQNNDIMKLEIKLKTNEIDRMSAEIISSLSILDDLDMVLSSNIKKDSEEQKINMRDTSFDLDNYLNLVDLDSIDLDLNLLESFSSESFMDNFNDETI